MNEVARADRDPMVGRLVLFTGLGIVDALIVPVAIVLWVRTWTDHGGIIGATLCIFFLYRGVKRLWRVFTDIDNYDWFAPKLALFAGSLFLIGLLGKLTVHLLK